MSDSNGLSTAGKKVLLVVIAVVVALAALTWLNQPGGPVRETTGIVQALGNIPTDTGPPPKVAAVRLSDGTLGRASVFASAVVQPGQTARIKVYRRVLSGTESYEIIATER